MGGSMFKELGNNRLSKVDYHYLDVFFCGLSHLPDRINLTYVHGLLTAVISAPTLIPPNEWINIILSKEPKFENVIQAEKVMGLMIELYSQIVRQLKGEEPFKILYWNSSLNKEQEHSQECLLVDWCAGYLAGQQLDPLWGTDRSAKAMLTPFQVLAKEKSFVGQCDSQGRIILDDASFITEYQTHLHDFVLDIYAYWLHEREEDIKVKLNCLQSSSVSKITHPHQEDITWH